MNSFISIDAARDLLENHGAQLIDVRNPPEFSGGTAPGAVNIPVHVISDRANELDADKHILVFCRSGARSEQAKVILNGMGFSQVQNAGGLGHIMNCFEAV